MSSDSLESLVHEYEPYLRQMARRHLSPFLRTQIDSVDLVQSVWAHVLRAQNAGNERLADHAVLRAVLGKILRNRVIDHVRRMKASQRREQLSAPEQSQRQARTTRPSEFAQANELWSRIESLCPVQHRPILQLKRQGLSLEEIAAATSLHPSSVRRILYDLARQVARDSSPTESRG